MPPCVVDEHIVMAVPAVAYYNLGRYIDARRAIGGLLQASPMTFTTDVTQFLCYHTCTVCTHHFCLMAYCEYNGCIFLCLQKVLQPCCKTASQHRLLMNTRPASL